MKQEPPEYGYDTNEYNDMEYQNYYQYQNQEYQRGNSERIKSESTEDSYPFYNEMYSMPTPQAPVTPKKRGRPRKIRPEDGGPPTGPNQSPLNYMDSTKVIKERKKHDRFNGMSEEEVSMRTLPDHLAHDLDIVIVGINPGLFAAYKGHHYAGPGNHFWKCLYLSGLIPEPMTAEDDYKLLNLGIGFTNIVERATKGSADLTRKEIKLGGQILLEKLQKYRPKIAVFNGKYIYEVFSGKKDFNFGRQPELVEGTNTYMWVMPSSSARCAQLPRAADKVPFYAALKKFRDYLRGMVSEINENELVFSNFKMKNFMELEPKEDEREGCSYSYPNSVEDGSRKETETVPPKKKRGRPKKIKVEESPSPLPPPKPKDEANPPTPKPKVKEERTDDFHSENSNLSNHCFSPPIQTQSPMPNFSNMYQQQSQPQQQYHPSPQSPHFTPSPMQSPQSFQHSDLSSDLRAAISSDQPTSFSPYFSGSVEEAKSIEEKPYSSPQGKPPSYQSYDSSNYDDSYKTKPGQDVSSRSLSGLESLIDQMRNDTDEDSTFQPNDEVHRGQHHPPPQYDYDYHLSQKCVPLGPPPRLSNLDEYQYYPQYQPTYYPPQTSSPYFNNPQLYSNIS